jgi:group II intron reverse transcriptase/maturase
MTDTQRLAIMCTKQQRIAQIARERPQERLTALNQYLDIDWLKEAYGRVRKDSAPGVDGQTVENYSKELESNLRKLLDQAKNGTYQAPPVKRVNIPKDNGETRPIGIPTTEDKILQRAVVMLLEPIYEEAFYDFSYGFRPGRSAHQALSKFWEQATGLGIEWVLEVDIRKYFDSVDRQGLNKLVSQRIGDGVILRLLSKWLHAGVVEGGQLHYGEAGTPQGGVVSPLLSNIYLHEVFDRWFAEVVQERMEGRVFAVRYADDLVIGFTHRGDAQRVYRVIFQRFEKYGLKLHPEKTRLVAFGRPDRKGTDGQPTEQPEVFDFLGFTHYWGKARKGYWVIKRKTAAKRLRRSIRAAGDWCRRNRHRGMFDQFRALVRKLSGHYAYYGITGNGRALNQMRTATVKLWYKWLRRRSRESTALTWERMHRLLKEQFIFPYTRIVHSIYKAKP